MNDPAIIATSGGASRPTVDRLDDGSARITAPGNTAHIPAHLVEPLRLALLDLNTKPRLPEKDDWHPTCEGLSILVGADGAVVILTSCWQMVAIGTEDLACVAGGLG